MIEQYCAYRRPTWCLLGALYVLGFSKGVMDTYMLTHLQKRKKGLHASACNPLILYH